MKKNKRQRLRLKPLASAQKQGDSESADGKGLRRLGWFGGAVLLLVIAYSVFQKPSKPAAPVASEAPRTNRPFAAQNAKANTETAPNPDVTNKPGDTINLEAEGSADELNNAGVHLLNTGKPAQAVPIFQRAVSLKPDDETSHFNLAVAYAKSGDLSDAEHEYKEALRLLPDYPEAHNNYGNLLAHNGRTAEAEQHLTEAVNEMPESAQYNNSLGVLQQKLKKTNEALLSFQKAVQYDTNFLEAHFNLAEAYLDEHDRSKGIAELLEALRIKPDFAPAKRVLAGLTSMP